MRKALTGIEEKMPPIIVTDMDFADYIALVSEGIKESEVMLRRVELSAKCIVISMNTGKMKYMSYNNNQQFDINTIDGTYLKKVEDF